MSEPGRVTVTEADDETATDQIQIDPAAPDEYVDEETPMVVVPRGGTREVGRSCYQVETTAGTYLVDCGLKQGSESVGYPDFRGIDEGQVDAVILTHAHIDHTGALPLAEREGILDADAPVICTRPTAAILHTLLHDSVKIHQIEMEKMGRPERYDKDDVEAIIDRVEAVEYGQERIRRFIETDDDLLLEFGDAAHLLGSAWIGLESKGHRLLISGDLGERSAHLGKIDTPPGADTLLLESTYGSRDTHPSFDDARTELWRTIVDATERDIPVLIPTFAVGRAQEVLQIIRERWRNLDESIRADLDVVYDGMAGDTTSIYNAWGSGPYVSESINNYRANAEDNEPFIPEIAWRPSDREDRAELFDGERAPLVVAPSGMLTGGLSPVYLVDLVRNYDEARVVFTGYQAEGTPGRALQEASGSTAEITVTARMWDEHDTSEPDEQPSFEKAISVPTRWVETIEGFSGHAARVRLLQFAREVDPAHIGLIHGPSAAQRDMQAYLEDNTSVETITRTAITEPFTVGPAMGATGSAETGVEQYLPAELRETGDSGSGDDGTVPSRDEMELEERVDALEQAVVRLSRELAAARNEGRTEADLRRLIRDELD